MVVLFHEEYDMNRYSRKSVEYILIYLFIGTLAACATIQVNPIPAPPPTAKLRVYVQPLTGEGKWGTSHEVYVQNQIRRVERFLEKTGIYDVVGEQDVRTVLGGQRIERSQLEQNGWAPARRIGEALHADYVMVMERVMQRGAVGGKDFLFVNVMINVGTGKVFESRTQIVGMTRGDREEQRELMRMTYRDIFQSCKQDMLSTAIRKGRSSPSAPVKPEPAESREETPPPSAVKQLTPPPTPTPGPKKETPPVVAKVSPEPVAAPEPAAAPNLAGSGLIEASRKDTGAKKLVVYDFDVNDQYRVAALILAEALREELFKLKQFVLVNREDLQKVLEEMALQQTGLIDEKEAVRTGKGLAASQVVTGRLGQLGKTFVMQAKRVDVETFGTLGLASIKFTEGQEEEALNRLPDFARSLVGLQQ
ncbi:MAG: CsgG/HfaB family protein [Nitrospirota bacterium]